MINLALIVSGLSLLSNRTNSNSRLYNFGQLTFDRRKRDAADVKIAGRPMGEAYATALIEFATFSTISPIWSSLTMNGGVSSMVSPARRNMMPSSWKECSSSL